MDLILDPVAPDDQQRVSLDDAGDVLRWTTHFDVLEPELRAAMASVGSMAYALKKYFARLDRP